MTDSERIAELEALIVKWGEIYRRYAVVQKEFGYKSNYDICQAAAYADAEIQHVAQSIQHRQSLKGSDPR